MFLLGLLYLHAAHGATAQTVSGRIVDAETGERLPNANVQVEGTLRGTVSNQDGLFRIDLDALPASLLVRYIGYESERRTVDMAGPFELTIRLRPVTYELGEVVVSGEDPAVQIMRRVIERKQEWRASLASYRADAYNRYTLANDTGIVMISETLTEAYWDRERGSREVVKAERRTANVDFEDVLPDRPYVVNLYDDDVFLSGFRFIGVTHPRALEVYDFRLENTRRMDDLAVFDVSVRPKRRTESAFVGRVAVLDSAFALLEAELRPGEAFLFPPPIETYTVSMTQQFSNFGQDFWLPVDFRREAHLKIRWGFLVTVPDIHVRQVSRLTDYRVNVPVPDSLYGHGRYSIVDSAAVSATRMEAAAVVPLTAGEETAFAGIDSTLTLREAFPPGGLLAPTISYRDGREYRSARPAFRPQIRRNRVEDVRIGLEAGRRFGNVWVEGQSAYLTGPGEWTAGASARVRPRRAVALEAGYHWTFDPRTALWTDRRDRSDFTSVVAGGDQYDYFRNHRSYVQASFALPVRRSEAEVRFSRESHKSYFLPGTAPSSEARDRVNPSIDDGLLASLGARLTFGRDVGFVGGNRLQLAVEHSDPALFGSAFSFTHFSATLDLRFETLLKRRFLPNTLDVRLAGSMTAGELPVQRTALVEGSTRLIDPLHFSRFGSLRALEHRVYQGDRTLAVFWEHNFRTLPFEVIGWDWAARKSLGIVLHGGHARSWLTDRLAEKIGYPGAAPSRFHHEVGASLNGIFGIFRLDATRRLDGSGFALGLGVARIL